MKYIIISMISFNCMAFTATLKVTQFNTFETVKTNNFNSSNVIKSSKQLRDNIKKLQNDQVKQNKELKQ